MMMRALLCFLTLALPSLAVAGVYKSIQPDGSVVFTDEPRKDATKIEIPKAQTYSAPPKADAKNSAAGAKPPQPAKPKSETIYEQLAILAPGKDATVRQDAGDIEVQVGLAPALDSKKGHKLALDLDGRRMTEPSTNSQFTLENIDRGTHTVQAHILDEAGQILRSSDPVIFHVKRHSALQ